MEPVPKHTRRELTLLLLGATGVGKSTFINAIANYLTYGSLDEALRSPSVNLIPLQFKITDANYEMQTIEMGCKDDNEHMEAGASATQTARTYTFQSADILLRCIDTPGIGDVRGKDQDKANFEFIMNHLGYLSLINGICIFLEPNCSRLNEYFAFCVDELLTHLHKDACKNIVFLFCKSRSTNYAPGDSLPTLIKLIQEKNYEGIIPNKDTIYCIDNEPIRFLAKNDNGFPLSEVERTSCVMSWDESSKAIGRLISHISSLKPHLIKNTACLHEAKNTVYALVEPMLYICEILSKNIEMLEKKKQEVDSWRDGDVSKANLNIPQIVMETKTINPRLVCASVKCTTKVMKGGVLIENYDQCCHEDCYIKGLKFLNKITALNRLCEVMNEGVCTKCWCSWEFHKHITCEYVEKIVEKKSSVNNQTEDIADFVSRLDETIKMHQGEQHIIIDVGATLGIFLDQNSIRLSCDVVVDRIKQMMAFEDKLIDNGGNNTKKVTLESLLSKYQSKKQELIEQGIRVFPTDVNYQTNRLYNLPMNGKAIVESLEATLNANAKNGLKTEIVLACRLAISALQDKWKAFAKF